MASIADMIDSRLNRWLVIDVLSHLKSGAGGRTTEAFLDQACDSYDRLRAQNAALRKAVNNHDRLTAERQELVEALEAVQWAGRDSFRCVECGGQPSTGHTASCRVGRTLARLQHGEG